MASKTFYEPGSEIIRLALSKAPMPWSSPSRPSTKQLDPSESPISLQGPSSRPTVGSLDQPSRLTQHLVAQQAFSSGLPPSSEQQSVKESSRTPRRTVARNVREYYTVILPIIKTTKGTLHSSHEGSFFKLQEANGRAKANSEHERDFEES